jgi:hypothetical protein
MKDKLAIQFETRGSLLHLNTIKDEIVPSLEKLAKQSTDLDVDRKIITVWCDFNGKVEEYIVREYMKEYDARSEVGDMSYRYTPAEVKKLS